MQSVTQRFLRYVSFDTKSDPNSETCPSSAKQKLLGAALVEEMKAMGIEDARMDENGYVYGTVPGDPRLRTALDDIGDVDILFPVQIDDGKHIIQQLTRGANEGKTLQILLLTGAFAHEHNVCIFIAHTKYHIVPLFAQTAFDAG